MKYPFGQPAAGMDVLWRCEAKRYSIVIDAEADYYGTSDPELEMQWWQVRHRTPNGARLMIDKFVLLTATKRWACNTEAEALVSFVARKNCQIAILTGHLRKAEADLALAGNARLLKPILFAAVYNSWC